MTRLPRLSAVQVAQGDAPPSHAAWCPWCEALHYHGSGSGSRSAHCFDRTGSPLPQTGYELDVVAGPAVASAARPDVLIAGEGAHLALGRVRANLRRIVLAALLAMSRTSSPFVVCKLRGTQRRLMAWPSWSGKWVVTEGGQLRAGGDDLLTLGAHLYAIPAGVVAVRVLEAASGARMDAAGALAVQAAVDAWIARGAEPGEGRRS